VKNLTEALMQPDVVLFYKEVTAWL